MEKNKAKINYIIDFLMALCFLIVAISLILFLFYPSGPRGRWQQTANIFGGCGLKQVHSIFGILMVLFVIFHFILHWKWIVLMAKNLLRKEK
jgi:heme/copper-type cytochrome/quinol oxidase subunit 4